MPAKSLVALFLLNLICIKDPYMKVVADIKLL